MPPPPVLLPSMLRDNPHLSKYILHVSCQNELPVCTSQNIYDPKSANVSERLSLPLFVLWLGTASFFSVMWVCDTTSCNQRLYGLHILHFCVCELQLLLCFVLGAKRGGRQLFVVAKTNFFMLSQKQQELFHTSLCNICVATLHVGTKAFFIAVVYQRQIYFLFTLSSSAKHRRHVDTFDVLQVDQCRTDKLTGWCCDCWQVSN